MVYGQNVQKVLCFPGDGNATVAHVMFMHDGGASYHILENVKPSEAFIDFLAISTGGL